MIDRGDKQFADHLVHELRHVLMALRATKRMLSRGAKETSVMANLQSQSIDRVQKLIDDCRSLPTTLPNTLIVRRPGDPAKSARDGENRI